MTRPAGWWYAISMYSYRFEVNDKSIGQADLPAPLELKTPIRIDGAMYYSQRIWLDVTTSTQTVTYVVDLRTLDGPAVTSHPRG